MSRSLRLLSVVMGSGIASILLAGVCPSVAAPHPPELLPNTLPAKRRCQRSPRLISPRFPSRWSWNRPVIQLIGPRSQAHVLVSARFADGSLRDVTDKATFTPKNAALLALEADGSLHPRKDGDTLLACAYGGKTASVKVSVKDAQKAIPVSFTNEVIPLFTRLGCNQGACHGAQYGKGGYKLSLAGFDPDLDYANTVKQAKGRRVSAVDAGRSLLLAKPLMNVPHGGGRRLERDTPAYATLLQWLRDGAPGPNPNDPAVTKIDVYPAERVLQKQNGSLHLVVRATYANGATRDVTATTRLNTLNDGIAACTPDGLITPVGKGQTAIMARYSGQAAVATVLVPFQSGNREQGTGNRKGEKEKRRRGEEENITLNPQTGRPPAGKDTTLNPSATIDSFVLRKQRQLGLVASPVCDDRTFIRRVSLDLIGTMPTPDEINAFVADKRSDKRALWIETLLSRPEYADYWTLKWGDLLRSNRQTLGAKGMWSFTNWIRTQLQQNRPVDQFVNDLIMAQGSTFTNGPANYYRVVSDPKDLAETTSQVFLGVRMQCAKCHNHPFEKWTQADYYQFAAFFARVGIKGSQEFGLFGNEQIVRINDGGEVYHPKTSAKMRPTPLGVQLVSLPGKTDAPPADPDANGDRRRALADWLTAPTNRLFARNIANRYWGYMFGKGLVNPIDDMRVTNPPTNPQLLDFLADELTRSHYDLKHLLTIICNSQAYQRSSEATGDSLKDELFFTHYMPKRLGAETLLDAIDFACGTQEKFNQLPPGTRAIQLPDPNVGSDFLDTFGRPLRIISCECERTVEPNLSQTLRLMNGELVNRKIGQSEGRIFKMVTAKKSNDAILNDIYMAALGRPPRREERLQVMGALAFAPDRKPVFEDVLLTLLNSKEFLFNH